MKTKTDAYLLELRFKRPIYSDMFHVEGAESANTYIREIIDEGLINHKEYFWIILLTHSHRVLGVKEISSGKTESTTVSFKEMAQVAILSNASSCIMVHNHPSGNLGPSEQDRELTRKAQEMFRLIDIKLLDHLILTQEGYYSFSRYNHIIQL